MHLQLEDDGARLDNAADSFWGDHCERAFFDVLIFDSVAHSNCQPCESFTADQFGVMCQVLAKSVWLFGTKVYFPNNSGAFDFSSLDHQMRPLIEVMGRSLQPVPRCATKA